MVLVLQADGLPLLRREHGTEDDLIAGKDFLSVLMDLSTINKLEVTTRHPQPPSVTIPTSIQLEHYSATYAPIVRESRSTHFTSSIQKPAANTSLMPTKSLSEVNIFEPHQFSEFSKRRLVSVSISSSVAETHRILPSKASSTTESVKMMSTNQPVNNFDNVFFPSEDRQSFAAEANRHELSIEEPEPITKNVDAFLVDELPANVQAIPVIKKLSEFEKTSELFKELSHEKLKDKLPPFHHTVIYHDNLNEQISSRSPGYSTVIQNAPLERERWGKISKPEEVESTQNSMVGYNSKDQVNLGKSKEPDWDALEISTGKNIEPTEMNWGVQQKALKIKQNIPVVYGESEENYEIDEAVSVQTNGRIHGVQPSQPTEEDQQKPTAKSKNGYVIEGRKERRYRVEERTPDGFIVGEFGIVNRDDGLLRGVRYTAEETINPKLIYDTLMKFLSL